MHKFHTFLYVLSLLILQACSGDFSGGEKHQNSVNKQSTEPLFKLLSADKSGIEFKNTVVETEENNYFVNQYIYNGGGVAIGDINNDGLDDIYFTGNDTPDKLYLNKGGLKFEDISASSGIDISEDSWSTGVSFVDLNADGWLDIYVCKAGHTQSAEKRKNQLYMNLKDGTFFLDKENALSDVSSSTQASFCDFDLDGDLDAYVLNYPASFDLEDMQKGNPQDSDHLFRNDGQGKFTDVTAEAGVQNYAFGLGVITADFDGDQLPDIYVANDYLENDFLYINQGNGRFTDEIKRRTGHNSQSSMGVDRADINNDGFEEFFVAEMLPSDYKRSKENMASMDIASFWYFISQGHHYQYMHNVLQLNQQNGYFSDISQMAGVDKTDWSWSPVMEDFDNDGFIDLFISNGIKRDMLNKDAKNKRKVLQKKESPTVNQLYELIPSTKLENYISKNQGDLTFSNNTKDWGLSQKTFSNGAAASDLDNDGDLDLVINNLDDRAYIYENTCSDYTNSVQLELKWPRSPNLHAVNSKVELYHNGAVISREMLPSTGFQSGTHSKLHIGLGEWSKLDSARVIWPNGAVQNIQLDLASNSTIPVEYNPSYTLKKTISKKYFREVNPSDLGLKHLHQENKFDDFEKEILLPHRQSTLGPFIEVADLNKDGLEDVLLGGASGQKAALFLQKSDGTFTKSTLGENAEWENQAAALFDIDNDQDVDIFLVNGGSEPAIDKRNMIYMNQGSQNWIKSPRSRNPEFLNNSCIVHADFDRDGFEDVFIGGGSKPNQYPMAEVSMVLWNRNGRFEKDSTWTVNLPEAGFVTDVLVIDFNSDNLPDLVVAGEWMSLHFFQNTGSGFKEVSSDLGIASEIGWWTHLHAVDLNGDGIDDIIAGNMGKNHKFRPSTEKPFMIYYDDYDGNGQGDIVLANTFDNGTCLPVRGKQCMSEQMPFISEEKVNSYNQFAESDLPGLLGKNPEESAVSIAATHFESAVFYSQPDGTFQKEILPNQAQIGPVNCVLSMDINRDGNLDLITAGNRYNTEVETTRADAHVGTVLLSGTQPVMNTGFFAPGNVKDMERILIGNDSYILVANNNGSLQVFKVLKS